MGSLQEEVKQLISIPSVTTEGNEELTHYLTTLLQDHGLKVKLQQVAHSNPEISSRQFNLIAYFGELLVDRKVQEGVLFLSHMDTVSPGKKQDWTKSLGNPYWVSIEDEYFYGLGVAEGKIDFLCQLHALKRFREKKLRRPLFLVSSCAEQRGQMGARFLLESLALNPEYTVVGAPSGLNIIGAQKSYQVFRVSIDYPVIERDSRGFNRKAFLKAEGKGYHSAYPDRGKNALDLLVAFLQETVEYGFEFQLTSLKGGDKSSQIPPTASAELYLTSHQFEDFKRFFREISKEEKYRDHLEVELEGLGERGVPFLPEDLFPALQELVGFFGKIDENFQQASDSRFDPPYSTQNLSYIEQERGRTHIAFDLRVLPETNLSEIQQRIESGIRRLGHRYPNLNISVTRDRHHPGFEMNHDGNTLIREAQIAAEQTQLESQTVASSVCTAAGVFHQRSNEVMAFGPAGADSNLQAPNEKVKIESVEKAIDFYTALIERLCL